MLYNLPLLTVLLPSYALVLLGQYRDPLWVFVATTELRKRFLLDTVVACRAARGQLTLWTGLVVRSN